MVTLKLYRGQEPITVLCICHDNTYFQKPFNGGYAFGYSNFAQKVIGINLDLFKHREKVFFFQIFFHECLHYILRDYKSTTIIHKVHEKSRWLLC